METKRNNWERETIKSNDLTHAVFNGDEITPIYSDRRHHQDILRHIDSKMGRILGNNLQNMLEDFNY